MGCQVIVVFGQVVADQVIVFVADQVTVDKVICPKGL